MLVNSVFAAAFLAAKKRRKALLVAASAAVVILQTGQWLAPPPVAADHTALLVQPDIPIQTGEVWTKEYFQDTRRDLTAISLHPTGEKAGQRYDLIVWPESPSPFYTNDRMFRDAVSELARESRTWVVAGSIGITPAMDATMKDTMHGTMSTTMNSGGARPHDFYSPARGHTHREWVVRDDKEELVAFGGNLPTPQGVSVA